MTPPLLNPRLFNPLYWHLKPLLQDPAIRYIFIEGGSSAAKTYTITQAITIDSMENDYSAIVFRRFHVNIKDTIKKTFSIAQKKIGLSPYFKEIEDEFRCTENKKSIRFKGLDDEENIKGIEDFNIVYNNEWSQFTESQWGQQRKRLRGRPNQKFICDWNPISSKLWIYENWIDKDEWTDLSLTIEAPTKYNSLDPEHSFKRINKKGDSIWIKTTFRDNYWIVGHPSGQGGFYDDHTLADYEHDRIYNPNLYRVYANGERGIIRTGGEFLKQFNELKHVKPVKYEKATLHITLDNNVNPYVTVSCWQVNVSLKKIRQVFELPCKSPDNNAPKAAAKLVTWLNAIQHEDIVYIYGDPSASARSTVDQDNKSFFSKFIEVLSLAGVRTVNRVQKSAPEVAMSANFINAIFEYNLNGWTIEIGDNCKTSIDDYVSVKEDKDGSMLKVKVKDKESGVTYEPHGHFCVIGSTNIKTSCGDKMMKDIKAGDYVLTRMGYKKVTHHTITGYNKDVETYCFGDNTLTCTGDHKIFANGEFKEAKSLMQSDILCIFNETKKALCLEKPLYSIREVFTVILLQNLNQIGVIIGDGLLLTGNEKRNTCTDTCGQLKKGLFQRTIMFIMLMIITTIIQLTTLFWNIIRSISGNIWKESMNLLKQIEQKFLLPLRKKLQKFGINRKKDGRGIENTLNKKYGLIKNTFAKCAMLNLRAKLHLSLNSVRIIANQTTEESKGRILRHAFAKCVILNLKLIGIQSRVLVHGHVPAYLEKNETVYDMTVEDASEYVANNVLIHNCDAFRYFIIALLFAEFQAYKARGKRVGSIAVPRG